MSNRRKTAAISPSHKPLKHQRNNNNTIKNINSNDSDDEVVSLAIGGPVTRQNVSKASNISFSMQNSPLSEITPQDHVNWITNLNRRTEIVMLLRHAQERATVSQLAGNNMDEKSLKFEIDNLVKSYSAVLASQQAQIHQLTTSNTSTQQQFDDLQLQNAALQKQIANLRLEKRDFDKNSKKIALQIDTYTTQIESKDERIETLEAELERINGEMDDLLEEMNGDDDDDGDDDGMKNKNNKNKKSTKKGSTKKNELVAKTTTLEARVRLLESQLEVERNQHKQEYENYKNKINKLVQEKTSNAEELEEEFKLRLEDALEEQHQLRQQELEELANTLGQQNENMTKRLTEQLLKSRESVNALTTVKTVLESQITELRQDTIILESRVDALEKQTTTLHEELTVALDNHSNDVTLYEQALDEMTELYEDKERLFDELMSVKVSLALEIAQYRNLLENEENKLKIAPTSSSSNRSSVLPTPSNPRRSSRRKMGDDDVDDDNNNDDDNTKGHTPAKGRNNNTKKTTKNDNSNNQDRLSTLVQTGINLNGKYVKFTNGSTNNIELNGFRVQNEYSGDFVILDSDDVLEPNQQFIVYFVKPSKRDVDNLMKLGHILYDLSDDNIFDHNDHHDKRGQLIDPLGRIVNTFEFINKGRGKKVE